MPNKAWLCPGTTKNLHIFCLVLCSMFTLHMPNCVTVVLLFVFHWIFLFLVAANCCSFIKDLCDARPKMHSVFKFSDNLSALSQMDPTDETSGHVEIFVISSGQVDLWSDVPPVSDILWPSVLLLWDRLTFGQIYPQDVASGQVDIWSGLQVRLTFGQMYPQSETSCGQVCYYFGTG